MQIKICGLTNKQNIMQVLSLQPDYIGFLFYKGSKRYIGDSAGLADYIAGIDTAKKTGVFVNAPQNEIVATISRYKLDAVQLHGTETPTECSRLTRYAMVIKTFHINEQFDFSITAQYASSCNYFLFDTAGTEYGGSGQSFDWSLLSRYTSHLPFFLSGGIGPEHASRLREIHNKSLMAVDINSRFETNPGIKNINLLKPFINEIRN